VSFRINTNVNAMNALRNLGQTNIDLSKTTSRLSTGLRINNAGDDPSGLIMSESLRAQISGAEQAIRNNQDALNYAKTAEGALDEVSRIMRDARSLAVASANTGVLSSTQIQSNQTQFNLLMSSLNRVATETSFGNKKLLDGTAGVQALVVNSVALESVYFGGKIGDQNITADGAVSVNVTSAATKATLDGSRAVTTADLATYQNTAVGFAGQFSINGQTLQVSATDTWGAVVQKINAASGTTGVVAEAIHNGTAGHIRLRTSDYGTNAEIDLVDAGAVLQSAAGATSVAGTDAAATVTLGALTPVAFTAGQNGNDGLTLQDQNGNKIVLTEAGNAVANLAAAAQVIAGGVQFQVGGNAGQTEQLSLGAFTKTALGLDGLDLTTAQGASDVITAMDTALEELNKRRGEIGSFMRNVLEVNIRSLGVQKENMSATESTIRDIDVAEEMTNYTKLQILQQSGLAVLGQANSSPQAVLRLLQS
jgi:flagellin